MLEGGSDWRGAVRGGGLSADSLCFGIKPRQMQKLQCERHESKA